ncbi:hypothetical protein QJQ45_007108 [Haematococcus lacustris]|nr:hypothetical protein QJQ45_007108 [Haematococcus lacustris]
MSEAPQHAKRRMVSGLRGTSLPPPLLPNGLGGSSLKKHKTQHKTKSAWVTEQLTAVTAPTSDPDETDGAVNFVLRYMCNHCQDNLAGSNKDRLKIHLLRCSKFLASTQAMNIAKTFSEIAAAIEEYKQENKEVAELQQDAGTTPNSKSTARAGSGVVEDKGRFAKDLVKLIVDCNLPNVDNPTFKTFLATWVPAMPVPSGDQLSGPLLMALYANVMREVTQRLTRAQFFALTLDGWSRTQGSEHLLGFCAALPGGSSVFLDVVLTQDHSVTSDFMLAKITQILEKHNLTGKICGLVTDTPSSMQKLWCLVEAAMPKVLAMGRWAHILNLFFTGQIATIPVLTDMTVLIEIFADVKKLPRIFEHIEEAKDIVNLFAR